MLSFTLIDYFHWGCRSLRNPKGGLIVTKMCTALQQHKQNSSTPPEMGRGSCSIREAKTSLQFKRSSPGVPRNTRGSRCSVTHSNSSQEEGYQPTDGTVRQVTSINTGDGDTERERDHREHAGNPRDRWGYDKDDSMLVLWTCWLLKQLAPIRKQKRLSTNKV